MLIICSGPDTYHARKKARELVAAFREKFDSSGYSTDVLNDPDVEDVLNRLGSPSLFAQKRFIRCDGLLSSLKIADVRKLAKRLLADSDQTIVLSVEDEPLSSKIETEFEGVKIVSYPFPLLSGRAFEEAVSALANQHRVSAQRTKVVANCADGDMWYAEQEIEKCAANPEYQPVSLSTASTSSLFDLADAYLRGSLGWRSKLRSSEEADGASVVFSGQARSWNRVIDGEAGGLHPFVARKMQQLRSTRNQQQETIRQTEAALFASRTGLATAEESQNLFQ